MRYFPKDRPQESSKSIVLLLPLYLDETFIHLFNSMGFTVIHSHNPEVLEGEVRQFHIDLALEWQRGPEDYPIRDLIRKCNKNIPIFLMLNWNGRLPPNFSNLGYHEYLKVFPWENDEFMGKFYEALPESKKPILRDLWEKYGKEQG